MLMPSVVEGMEKVLPAPHYMPKGLVLLVAADLRVNLCFEHWHGPGPDGTGCSHLDASLRASSPPQSTCRGRGRILIQFLQSCELWGQKDTWCAFLAQGTQWHPDIRHELLTSPVSAGGGPPM